MTKQQLLRCIEGFPDGSEVHVGAAWRQFGSRVGMEIYLYWIDPETGVMSMTNLDNPDNAPSVRWCFTEHITMIGNRIVSREE